MRAIILAFALALLVAATSAKQYFGVQSQDDVKNNRWTNCSTVIHGRLGDLHNFSDNSWHIVRQNATYFFAYSPCMPMGLDLILSTPNVVPLFKDVIAAIKNQSTADDKSRAYTWILLQQVDNSSVRIAAHSVPGNTEPSDDKLVKFFMPEEKGDVPHFTATFTDIEVDKFPVPSPLTSATTEVTITVNCGEEDDVQLSVQNVTKTHGSITVFDLNACARFPYTNKAMPAGGIIALCVIIVCFVIQFSICGWYHATHKLDASPTDRAFSDME